MLMVKSLEDSDIVFLTELLNDERIVRSLHNSILPYAERLLIYNEIWKNDSDETHFIIIEDHVPIGWLKLNGLKNKDMAWISMLAIAGDYQGKGIGQKAVAFSEDKLKNLGFQKVGIHTTDDNIRAISLYKKCGYVITEHGQCTTGDGKERMGYTFEKEI